MGGAAYQPSTLPWRSPELPVLVAGGSVSPELAGLVPRAERLRAFHERLFGALLGGSYEAAHARVAVECVATALERARLKAEGKIDLLPEPSQAAADQSYVATAAKLCDGLEAVLRTYEGADDPHKQQVLKLWQAE